MNQKIVINKDTTYILYRLFNFIPLLKIKTKK